MPQRLLIVGAGFAGMYAALSGARLRDAAGGSPTELEIILVAPDAALIVRPRLYEPNPETMAAPLGPLLEAVDVAYMQGTVIQLDSQTNTVEAEAADGRNFALHYDRLVLACGSRLFRPPIPGLAQYGFSVDQLADAVALDRHLQRLAKQPASKARNTVVVAGGGFTGVEVATELPTRLRDLFGSDTDLRVVIVDRGEAIASDLGAGPRPLIEAALRDLSVESRLGVGVTALDETGVTLSDGTHIDSATVVWAAGMRANPLTEQLAVERDRFGRVIVERDLRVPGVPTVFAAGDVAQAATDDLGHSSLMSCQHANRLGAAAGHNAMSDLLGWATEPYRQPNYVTCLDLGGAGAVFTRGWDRVVEMTGDEAKTMKQEINTKWIYPPAAEKTAAFAAADWARLVDY